MTLHSLSVCDTLMFWRGPAAGRGPLPAIFYLAISGQETLICTPFSDPLLSLDLQKIRVFSCDIPFHSSDQDPRNAMELWAEGLKKNPHCFQEFFQQMTTVMEQLIREGLCQRDQIGLMGLSRGGFLALHQLVYAPFIKALLAFAPVTHLRSIQEFANLSIPSLDLIPHAHILCRSSIRFYIGNHDTRVSTKSCFELLEAITSAGVQASIRHLPYEMYITPAIGHQGHGTPSASFQSGAQWLQQQLLVP